MAHVHHRLRAGRPAWQDHIVFRVVGLITLAGCGRVTAWLCAAIRFDPQAVSQWWVWPIALAAVVSLFCGLALTLAGPGLLMRVEYPERWFVPVVRQSASPRHMNPRPVQPEIELADTLGASVISWIVGMHRPPSPAARDIGGARQLRSKRS